MQADTPKTLELHNRLYLFSPRQRRRPWLGALLFAAPVVASKDG